MHLYSRLPTDLQTALPPLFRARAQKAIYGMAPCVNHEQINKRPISKKFYLVHGLTDNHNDRWMRIFREIRISIKRFVHVARDYLIDVTREGNLSIVLARQERRGETFATMATLPLTMGKIVSPSMAAIMLNDNSDDICNIWNGWRAINAVNNSCEQQVSLVSPVSHYTCCSLRSLEKW